MPSEIPTWMRLANDKVTLGEINQMDGMWTGDMAINSRRGRYNLDHGIVEFIKGEDLTPSPSGSVFFAKVTPKQLGFWGSFEELLDDSFLGKFELKLCRHFDAFLLRYAFREQHIGNTIIIGTEPIERYAGSEYFSLFKLKCFGHSSEPVDLYLGWEDYNKSLHDSRPKPCDQLVFRIRGTPC